MLYTCILETVTPGSKVEKDTRHCAREETRAVEIKWDRISEKGQNVGLWRMWGHFQKG